MPLAEFYLYAPSRFVLFVLVLTRISGVMLTAPVLGMRSAPMRIRAFLAMGMSLLVAPLVFEKPFTMPGNLIDLVLLMCGEAMIGLAIGSGVMILFSGLQVTGQLIGQMSGVQLAEAFDPSFNESVSVFSQLMDLVTLTVFVLIGGHREVLSALLGTFNDLPIGGAEFHAGITEAMTAVLTQSFSVGLRAAAPAMVALLMSILIMGLISRTLPQLNILAVGFSLNAIIMLSVLAISLGGVAWVFQEQVGPTLDGVRSMLTPTASSP